MNWYYVDAGKQAGPVDEAQLAELARNGKIQAETLVWREGMSNWQPCREVNAAVLAAVAPPVVSSETGTGSVICSECGRAFAPNEVIRYGEKWVCAVCKPVFFQRIREGAAMAPTAGAASEADLLGRDYEVDIGASLTRGWEVFKANAGMLIGVSVLVYVLMSAASLAAYVVMVVAGIPFLNTVALLVSAPLMGGLWKFYIKYIRNQAGQVGDAFSGFGPRYLQLVLVNLIPTLISVGCMALAGLVGALTVPGLSALGRSGRGVMTAAVFIPLGILFLVAMLAMIYLGTCWVFAMPLVSDKGMKFWPAMELSRRVVSKHWWMTFWLLVVVGVLGMAGVFACLFGLLVTLPVAFAMIASHYEKLFGDLIPAQSQPS
jgi:hypothetical protein